MPKYNDFELDIQSIERVELKVRETLYCVTVDKACRITSDELCEFN